MSEEIEAIGIYRGVGIDDCQGRDRIDGVVKPAIDAVFEMSEPEELLRYCRDVTRPPEARRFAAAKLEASFKVAASEHVTRPGFAIELVRASVPGLGKRRWRSPREFCSILDVPHEPGRPGPDARPAEYERAVEDDLVRLSEEERAAR